MVNLGTWLKALSRWLFEARLFWITIFVLGSCCCIAFAGISEDKIRLMGLVLQVFGIGTVVWGIRETRRLFGRPSLFDISRKWIQSFPHFNKQTKSASGNVGWGTASVNARGYQSFSTAENSAVEERIAALEEHIVRVDDRISQTQNNMDQLAKEQAKSLKQEETIRDKNDQEIREILEVTETGGLNISVMGATWLFVGVVMSTASSEIARWLQ